MAFALIGLLSCITHYGLEWVESVWKCMLYFSIIADLGKSEDGVADTIEEKLWHLFRKLNALVAVSKGR